MKNKILFLIVGFTIIFVGFVSYQSFFKNTKTLKSIHLIPRDAIFFIASDTPIKNWKFVRDSDVWKHLRTNSYFAEVTTSINTIDSTLIENKKLFDILGDRKAVISIHPISKRKYDYLFIIDLEKTAKLLHYKTLLKTILGNHYKITDRLFKDIEILEIFDKKKRTTLYLAVINNNLVTSYTHTLVEAAISQINESTVGRDLKFIEVNQKIRNNKLLKLYIQYNYLDEYTQILSGTSPSWIKDVSKTLVFSGFDVDLNTNSMLIAEGFTNSNDNSYTYLEAFRNAGLGKQEIDQVAPHRTSMYLSLGFKNFSSFYNNFQEINNTTTTTLKNKTDQIEKLLNIDIQKNFVDWVDNEVALLKLEPISSSGNTDIALVLKTKNKKLARENLAYILERIKKKTPVKFKQIDYKGYAINFMSIKGFFKVFLGGYFQDIETPYFTIIDNFVIFSNHPNTLKYIITNYIEKKTLVKASNYKNFKRHFSAKSNMFVYINTPMLYNSIYQHVDKTTQQQLTKNKAYFTSFSQIGIQLFPEKDAVFKSTFIIQYQDQDHLRYSDEFKSPMLGPSIDGLIPSIQSKPIVFSENEPDPMQILNINPKDLNTKQYVDTYNNGQIKVTIPIKNGLKHGIYKEYYKNGKLKLKGKFKKGIRVGKWKRYDTEGNLIKKARY